MADACLFCRMVAGEIPVTIVKDTGDCLAFRDINPQAPTHVLVIPKAHVASLNEASDAAMVGRVALVAAEIARDQGLAANGYRVVINTNGDGGQTVFHLHAHLLGGRKMTWPPG